MSKHNLKPDETKKKISEVFGWSDEAYDALVHIIGKEAITNCIKGDDSKTVSLIKTIESSKFTFESPNDYLVLGYAFCEAHDRLLKAMSKVMKTKLKGLIDEVLGDSDDEKPDVPPEIDMANKFINSKIAEAAKMVKDKLGDKAELVVMGGNGEEIYDSTKKPEEKKPERIVN